ncbi:MAG: hypothetical protein E7012_02895 [Alphaproteobacteria bacterium]|nr:hypothetical protein [Alphaproteobacteria bacterium]
MLFNKTETQTNISQRIAILGASALSLYMASILKTLGHQVEVICPPKEAEELNATDIIIKNTRKIQNLRQNLNFSHEITFSPDVFIIASDFSVLRRDLLLLSPSKLKESLIINLTPSFPQTLISDILKLPIINAFYFGWLSQHKNTITSLNKTPKISFSSPPKETAELDTIKNTFASSFLNIDFPTNEGDTYWNWLASNALVYFFETISEKNISSQIKNSTFKQDTDNFLKEISSLAAMVNASINKNNFLTSIYAIDELIYFSPKQDRNTRLILQDRFVSLLFSGTNSDSGRYPFLHNLIKQINNKLIV